MQFPFKIAGNSGCVEPNDGAGEFFAQLSHVCYWHPRALQSRKGA